MSVFAGCWGESVTAEEVVIGPGYIGSRLCELSGALDVSREVVDLLKLPQTLPQARIVYLMAGVNGTKACEDDRTSWRVNVDGTAELAWRYAAHRTHVVWLSSDMVEWGTGAYAEQKRATESLLRTHALAHRIAILRADRVTDENRDSLCKTLMLLGRKAAKGVHHWSGGAS